MSDYSPMLRSRHGSFDVLVTCFIAVILWAAGAPALAQSSDDTGVITITVTDAGTKHPLADARITLYGATQASALTNRSGVVKYTDVPSGLYRVRVGKSGFIGNISSQFEILGRKEVDVDVAMAAQASPAQPPASPPAGVNGMKVIGRVSARVSVTTRDVDSDSAIRRVSDSLTDALGKIAGVDITQSSNDPNAAQTISLNGHDESQTAVTLDGIPLGAPGAAVNLRSVNTDIFSGASASFAAQAGALGGSVNFRTLQPTQTWVTRLSASAGSFDAFNYQFGETGSFGKLGIAVLHTLRAANNPLTFNTYADTSGLTYAHDGESSNVGNFLKLRYGLGDRTTLNVTALQNNSGVALLCTQDVTVLPCGSGPGNTSASRFGFMYGTVQSLIGEVTTSLSTYVNSTTDNQNEALRYVNGISSPLVTRTATLARGIAFLTTVNLGKSTWTFNGSTFASTTAFVPVVDASRFVVPSAVGTTAQTYALSDLYKVNDRLSIGPNVSLASTSGSGAALLAGLAGTWRPQPADTFTASASVGSSQSPSGLVRTFSDPAAARFNCAAGTANVNGPGDRPGKQSALSYDASWTHTWNFGTFALDVYRQTQADQLVNAQIAATSLGFVSGDPYLAALQRYFQAPDVCGAGAVLDPANVYVTEPVGDTTRRYQGFTLSGRIALGPHLVMLPSYQTNGATVTAADARFAGLTSTTVLGAQLPGRPVHRGNVTFDGDLPRIRLELLANVQYVGSNNGQHIAPYALLNLGVSHALGAGRLSFLETNVFDTESAPFSSLLFAQPIPTTGGGRLYTAANPNAPRHFTVSYAFNTGAKAGAGGALPSRTAAGVQRPADAADATARPPESARGLGAFSPYPPPPGVDPLSVATTRGSCTPSAAAIAGPVLAQFRAAAAAYAGAMPVPPIDGLTLVPHGEPHGTTWYFEVRPKRAPATPGLDAGGPSRFGAGPPPSDGGATGPVGASGSERVTVAPRADTSAAGPRPVRDPADRAAIATFRATLSCAYFSALAQSDARNAGYTAFIGRNGLGYAPRIGLFAVRAPELGTGGGSLKH